MKWIDLCYTSVVYIIHESACIKISFIKYSLWLRHVIVTESEWASYDFFIWWVKKYFPFMTWKYSIQELKSSCSWNCANFVALERKTIGSNHYCTKPWDRQLISINIEMKIALGLGYKRESLHRPYSANGNINQSYMKILNFTVRLRAVNNVTWGWNYQLGPRKYQCLKYCWVWFPVKTRLQTKVGDSIFPSFQGVVWVDDVWD